MKKILLLVSFMGLLLVSADAQYSKAPKARTGKNKAYKSMCAKKKRQFKRGGTSGVLKGRKTNTNYKKRKAKKRRRASARRS